LGAKFVHTLALLRFAGQCMDMRYGFIEEGHQAIPGIRAESCCHLGGALIRTIERLPEQPSIVREHVDCDATPAAGIRRL
jgi:hypothetical protein